MDSVTTQNFQLPKWDAQKWGRVIIGICLLAGLGYAFAIYLLPFLVSLAWNLIQLIVGGVIVIILGMIVTSKKFWRGIHYLTEGIARNTLGFIIEMNPFEILLERVEQGEKDRQELKRNGDKLKAQQTDLSMQIEQNDKLMRNSAAEVTTGKKYLTTVSPNSKEYFQTQMDLQTSSTNYTNAKDFIDELKPLLNNIEKLIDFSDKAYMKAGVELQNARNTIKLQQAKYKAVTTANAAMTSAMKAFFGDSDLNKDADQALDALRVDIAKKLGNMKSAIEVTSGIMSHNDLRDAAKMELAMDAINKFDTNPDFSYSKSLTNSTDSLTTAIPISTGTSNRFSDFLNTKK